MVREVGVVLNSFAGIHCHTVVNWPGQVTIEAVCGQGVSIRVTELLLRSNYAASGGQTRLKLVFLLMTGSAIYVALRCWTRNLVYNHNGNNMVTCTRHATAQGLTAGCIKIASNIQC